MEYRVLAYKHSDLEEYLNKMAKDGWRLISLVNKPIIGSEYKYTVVMERPLVRSQMMNTRMIRLEL